jgi:hypothetical protein
MFGVPVDGPTNVFCDNGAVCTNAPRPKSTLTKKQHSNACHRSQEALAAGTVRMSKEHASTNLADIFAKTMAAARPFHALSAARTNKTKRQTGGCAFSTPGWVFHKQST